MSSFGHNSQRDRERQCQWIRAKLNLPGSSVSHSQTLLLSDPPGKAFLRIDAEEVVKGDAVTLTCDVGDPGRPEADRFVWMRGRHVVSHVHGRNWTVDPVTLQTKANISCVAVNAVGEGERDSVDVEVFGESEWEGVVRRAQSQKCPSKFPIR